ncbi:Pc18g06700 [Penicillium rubens Wisconsin 54-1255]|uniref:Pc18g06700 protein n=1 Tax=Penicillium rubens (strain ATCC 28089 / DSM 1075 / NRRL 1951 / Wisconsin 54-1255) TaxID=500485 RepID=B6HCU2_PENRW|nr:Pc18g06700 [Penicillium rubens Wisconsin 54-1255]
MPVKIGSEKSPLPGINPVLVPPCSAADVTPGLCRAYQVHHANETTYARMLREEAQMDMRFSITVGAANWALLAGYLVIPGTFTSLQTSNQVEKTLQTNRTGRAVLHMIQNPPLLAIACLLFVSGIAALIPLCLHAAAGLLTTVINVCTSQGGDWSVMAIITTVVTGVTLLICSALLALYNFFKLERVRKEDEDIRRYRASIAPDT